MRVITALGNEQLEDYIDSLEGIEVVTRLKTAQKIVDKVKEEEPSILFIYHKIPMFDEKKKIEIIKKVSKIPNLRIVYVYGTDDQDRRYYIDYLISCGIYDYCVGDLNPEIVHELIFKKKSRDEVKKDILEIENKLIKGKGKIVSDVIIKEVPKIEKVTETIYKPHTLKQKVISITGNGGSGKTTVALNMALGFAKGLKDSIDTKIIVVDLNFMKPDVAYHLELTDDERSINNMIPKIKPKELSVAEFERNIITPFKNYPNLHVLNGMTEMNSEHTKLENEDMMYLLNTIKNTHDIIILDTNGDMENSFTRFAHNNANINMLVSDFNIAQLEHLKREFIKLKEDKDIRFDLEKYVLVVNKHFESSSLEDSDFAECLEIKQQFKIPSDISIFGESINNKKPVMFDDKEVSERARKSISQICENIHPIEVDVKQKKKRFDFSLKKLLKKGGK